MTLHHLSSINQAIENDVHNNLDDHKDEYRYQRMIYL